MQSHRSTTVFETGGPQKVIIKVRQRKRFVWCAILRGPTKPGVITVDQYKETIYHKSSRKPLQAPLLPPPTETAAMLFFLLGPRRLRAALFLVVVVQDGAVAVVAVGKGDLEAGDGQRTYEGLDDGRHARRRGQHRRAGAKGRRRQLRHQAGAGRRVVRAVTRAGRRAKHFS